MADTAQSLRESESWEKFLPTKKEVDDLTHEMVCEYLRDYRDTTYNQAMEILKTDIEYAIDQISERNCVKYWRN